MKPRDLLLGFVFFIFVSSSEELRGRVDQEQRLSHVQGNIETYGDNKRVKRDDKHSDKVSYDNKLLLMRK